MSEGNINVTVQVPAGSIGSTVLELFTNLTEKQKNKMALDVLKEWLRVPDFFAPDYFESIVLAGYRDGTYKMWTNKHNTRPSELTDEEIKADYRYNENLAKITHPQAHLMNEIRQQILQLSVEQIKNDIKANEFVQQSIQLNIDKVITDLPRIIEQTITQLFVSVLFESHHTVNEMAQKLMMERYQQNQ